MEFFFLPQSLKLVFILYVYNNLEIEESLNKKGKRTEKKCLDTSYIGKNNELYV